jgi:hypothetical protein
VIIFLSGLFDLIVINIPFQDPTSELIVKRNQQYLIRDGIFYVGVGLLILGLIVFFKRKLIK